MVEEVNFLLTACIHYREHILPCLLAQLRSCTIAYLPLDDSFADGYLGRIIMDGNKWIIEHLERIL